MEMVVGWVTEVGRGFREGGLEHSFFYILTTSLENVAVKCVTPTWGRGINFREL